MAAGPTTNTTDVRQGRARRDRLETVRRATTREEREAIYRFRYSVYVEEYGRELGKPDHTRRQVCDADDEKPYTTLLYTGTPEHITGTLRVRAWAPGEVPVYDREELSISRFPDFEERHIAELGRLMVCPGERGQAILAALLRASFEVAICEQGADLALAYCSPALLPLYRRIGLRPYGGRLVHAPDGIMVPIATVPADVEHFRACGSIFTSMARRHLRRHPPRFDLDAYRSLFDRESGVELDPDAIWEAARGVLLDTNGEPNGVFAGLPVDELRALATEGFVVEVEAGALVTRQGFRERELYVPLTGHFAVEVDGVVIARRARGEVFGEDGVLSSDCRRQASVRALPGGRVLVVRGRCLDKLGRRFPDLGAALERSLAEIEERATRNLSVC